MLVLLSKVIECGVWRAAIHSLNENPLPIYEPITPNQSRFNSVVIIATQIIFAQIILDSSLMVQHITLLGYIYQHTHSHTRTLVGLYSHAQY